MSLAERLVAILPNGEVIVAEGQISDPGREEWRLVGSGLTPRDAAHLAYVAAGWTRPPARPEGSPRPAPAAVRLPDGSEQLRCSQSGCPLWITQISLSGFPDQALCAAGEIAPSLVCYPAYLELAEEIDRARRLRKPNLSDRSDPLEVTGP